MGNEVKCELQIWIKYILSVSLLCVDYVVFCFSLIISFIYW